MSVIAICFCSFGPKLNWTISSAINLATVQSSEKSQKTFLTGFGKGLLKYCAIVQFWDGQRNILRVIFET